jgi:glycosyltransferase 2 family protein
MEGVAIPSREAIAILALKPYQGSKVCSPGLFVLFCNLSQGEIDEMRRILLSAIKVLVSAALLYFSLRKVNLSNLASRIGIASVGWIGLAIVLTFLQIFVGSLRWYEVSAECGAPLTTKQAMRFNLIGAFFNQTLPSSIGGDAVRLWLVARDGAGWRAAAYSILVDRAIGLIALAMIIVASLPWSYNLIGDSNGRSALLFVDFAALAGGLGFLVLGMLRWPWLKRLWGMHHLRACSVIANRVIFSRKQGPTIVVLSVLVHVIAVVVAWCVVQSIAAPVIFSQIFQLIPPVLLITMLPISIAGWGVREATLGLAFSYAGLMANEGVTVSLLFGAVFFIVGACGGLVWILSAEKAARCSTPIEILE